MSLWNWLFLKRLEEEMEKPKISEGLLYSRHWARCFLCIIPFNLNFFPSGGTISLNNQMRKLVLSGVNYLVPSPTVTFDAKLLFESSPSKI